MHLTSTPPLHYLPDRIHPAQGDGAANGLLQHGVGESRFTLFLAAKPIHLASVNAKVIDVRLQSHQLLRRRLVQGVMEKGKVESSGLFKIGGREGLESRNGPQFGLGADEGGDFEAERSVKVLFDCVLKASQVALLRLEHDIAAGDEGLDLAQADGLEQAAQVIHLDGVAADVDGAQEGNKFWHGLGRVLRSGRCSATRWAIGNVLHG